MNVLYSIIFNYIQFIFTLLTHKKTVEPDRQILDQSFGFNHFLHKTYLT